VSTVLICAVLRPPGLLLYWTQQGVLCPLVLYTYLVLWQSLTPLAGCVCVCPLLRTYTPAYCTRRWVYGPPAPSSMSLIRDISWDTAAWQLISFPVPELTKLRTKALMQPQSLGRLTPNTLETLPLPAGAGGSADVLLSFALPESVTAVGVAASGFGVAVRAPSNEYAGVAAVTMTVNHISAPDGSTGSRNVSLSFVTPDPKVNHDSNANATVLLLHGETLDVRVLIDKSIVEFFVMGGRAAYVACDKFYSPANSSVHIFTGAAPVVVANVSAWSMGCGWSHSMPVPVGELGPMVATTLLVEFRPAPVFGLGVPRPRFSWSLSAAERDVSSAAYQIIVSNSDRDKQATPVWDSGKVASGASHLVECAVALKPDTRYEWKVRWWASISGSPSPFSAVALLHTGLFSTADWHGAVPIGSLPAVSADPHPGVCARAGACHMISTKDIKGTDGYFEGEYSQLHSAKTIAACLAACDADPACTQATWDPSHTSPTGFAKCATFKSIGPNFKATVGVAVGWVKLSGGFLAGENGRVVCPVKGYPACCTWFETFADSTKHFISNCDTYPRACGPAQLSCWPDFDSQLPIKQVNASYLTGLTLGANYSCSMLNFHMSLIQRSCQGLALWTHLSTDKRWHQPIG
jgi:hypothetical protein